MSNTLSPTGRKMLADREAIIESGLAGFLAIGKALREINESTLYRDDFATFEAYLNGRWGMSKSRAYQLMQALELSTIVDELGCLPLANEGQLRALLPAMKDRKALVEIIGQAHAEGDTSARNLSKYVAAYAQLAPREKKPKDTHTEEGAGVEGPVTEGDVTGPHPGGDGADSHDAGRSEPEPAPSPPPVIDTTARETDDVCPFCKGTGRKWVQAS